MVDQKYKDTSERERMGRRKGGRKDEGEKLKKKKKKNKEEEGKKMRRRRKKKKYRGIKRGRKCRLKVLLIQSPCHQFPIKRAQLIMEKWENVEYILTGCN